jgi:hypothetical protein
MRSNLTAELDCEQSLTLVCRCCGVNGHAPGSGRGCNRPGAGQIATRPLRQTGMVGLTLPEHAEIPTVINIDDGFKAFQTRYGPTFRCAACDVEVDP